jgi:hypothetical protein
VSIKILQINAVAYSDPNRRGMIPKMKVLARCFSDMFLRARKKTRTFSLIMWTVLAPKSSGHGLRRLASLKAS